MRLSDRAPRTRYLLLLASVLLGGCGGGGGGGGGGGTGPDVELAALLVSTGSLSPAFSPETTDYVVGSVLLAASVRVTATVQGPGATLEVDGVATPSGSPSVPIALPHGIRPVAVTVTAADGRTSTYTIVFVRGAPGGQEAFVKASNTDQDDNFGAAVAISGDTLVVGGIGEDSGAKGVNPGAAAEADDGTGESGAAYVFVRSGGSWVQQAYLKASNTEASDLFGSSVGISRDTIVVGAPRRAGETGAVYVFVRSGTTWSEEAFLTASNADAGDAFGGAVAISEDTLVVGARGEASAARGVNPGAPAEADDSATSAGAAYVFVRNGTSWTQQAYLKASNTERDDSFGLAVAISRSTVVVGAFGESGAGRGVNPGAAAETANGARRAGAAYVFTRTGTTWSQEAYVKASNTDEDDFFGVAVAIAGDTVVVGATLESSGATGVNPGATAEDDDSARAAGAAYVFVRAAGVWTQQAYLKASNTDAEDIFGFAVAIAGDTIVVGASFEDGSGRGVNPGASAEDDDGAPDAGAAYVFVRVGATWTQTAYVKASNAGDADGFGGAVAVFGDTVVAGATGERSSAQGVNPSPPAEADDGLIQAGAVYVFR